MMINVLSPDTLAGLFVTAKYVLLLTWECVHVLCSQVVVSLYTAYKELYFKPNWQIPWLHTAHLLS